MNKLYFSYAARADLADIRDYISFELANPSAAKKTLSLIMKSINMLRDFANAGASLSSIASVRSDYRYVSVANYMVFYRVLGSEIFIDRVLYAKSNYLRTLLGEDSEE